MVFLMSAFFVVAGLWFEGETIADLITPVPDPAMNFADCVGRSIYASINLPVLVRIDREETLEQYEKRLNLSVQLTKQQHPNNDLGMFIFVRAVTNAIEVAVLKSHLAIGLYRNPLQGEDWVVNLSGLNGHANGSLPKQSVAIAATNIELSKLHLENLGRNTPGLPDFTELDKSITALFAPWKNSSNYSNPKFEQALKTHINRGFLFKKNLLRYGGLVWGIFAVVWAGFAIQTRYKNAKVVCPSTPSSVLFWKVCLAKESELQSWLNGITEAEQKAKARETEAERMERIWNRKISRLSQYFAPNTAESLAIRDASTVEQKHQLYEQLLLVLETRFLERRPAAKPVYSPREKTVLALQGPRPEPARAPVPTTKLSLGDLVELLFGKEDVFDLLPSNINRETAWNILICLIRGKKIFPRYASYSDLKKQVARRYSLTEAEFWQTLSWLEKQGVVESLPKGSEHTYTLTRNPGNAYCQQLAHLAVRTVMVLLGNKLAKAS